MATKKKRSSKKRIHMKHLPHTQRHIVKDLFGKFEASLKDKVEKFEEKTRLADFLGKTVSQDRIERLLEAYEKSNISIGVLGGHSALDICRGAKKHGFRTVVVCQKGREKTYSKYYKSRDNKGVVDEIILVDNFRDIVKREVQEKLREINTIFVHNRYFWVYCYFKDIEKKFMVPIFGTREMVKLEERDMPKNQYFLLEKAGIRIPKPFKDPKKIDRLVIVKVAEAKRGYERAFFFANSVTSDASNNGFPDSSLSMRAAKRAR